MALPDFVYDALVQWFNDLVKAETEQARKLR